MFQLRGKLVLALSFSLFASHTLAQIAEPVPILGSYRTAEFEDLIEQDKMLNRTYQIGDEWGKIPIRASDLENETPAFRRAIQATARVGGATGFYLGRFAGKHVMATNHHVMSQAWNCRTAQVRFPFLELRTSCREFLGTWKEIDLTLFTIEVSGSKADQLKQVAGNFQFNTHLAAETELLTAGFGVAENPSRQMTVNQDADCKTFSHAEDYRLLADPDTRNPGSYKAWSFAIGCDVSHGDSGSAVVTRDTGAVVGILWTGKIPKAPEIQDSSYLDNLLINSSDEIWRQLTYAVPAVKIGTVLQRQLSNPDTDQQVREILEAILDMQ